LPTTKICRHTVQTSMAWMTITFPLDQEPAGKSVLSANKSSSYTMSVSMYKTF